MLAVIKHGIVVSISRFDLVNIFPASNYRSLTHFFVLIVIFNFSLLSCDILGAFSILVLDVGLRFVSECFGIVWRALPRVVDSLRIKWVLLVKHLQRRQLMGIRDKLRLSADCLEVACFCVVVLNPG